MTEEWFTDAELARFLALGGGRRAEPMGGAPNSRGRRRYIVHDYFCRFDTLADAFAHHNRLLIEHPAYRAAMEQFGQDGNMDRLMDGIAKHYATAGDYADVLRQIAAQDNVRQAIARARAEA
jgi:flagellum-specific peptidoglycan hydrolase FlgJ